MLLALFSVNLVKGTHSNANVYLLLLALKKNYLLLMCFCSQFQNLLISSYGSLVGLSLVKV